MSYAFRRTMTEEESYKMGKELFEIWMDVGSLSKASMEYSRRHPEEPPMKYMALSRRVHAWWVMNTYEGMDIIKKHKPHIPEFVMHQKLIQYVPTVIKSNRNFKAWLEKNPWAKEYEYVYSDFYAL